MVLNGLKPERVFYYFEELTKIPRCSKKEQAVSNYLYKVGRSLGLETYQDGAKNIIIKKEATPGYEDKPAVILQGHMDMVCEKADDSCINFDTDPIEARVDGDFVVADSTTLGADNGIAVAMGLAIIEDNNLKHPKLELLITTDEETSMTGARNLDAKFLEGKLLINIDSEEEGVATVSCAGGERDNFMLPLERENAKDLNSIYEITVSGLEGGHSGIDINKGKGNSNILLGRTLYTALKKMELRIVEVNGGSKDNAIPRLAKAVVAVKADDSESLLEIVKKLDSEFKNEFHYTDSGVQLSISEVKTELKPMTADLTDRIVNMIMLMPNGVLTLSSTIEGLVESSTNLGVIETREKDVVLRCAPRSAVESIKEYMVDMFKIIADANGAELERTSAYPAWEYKENSPLRELVMATYKDMTGKDMLISATHGGLECGLFKEVIGDIEMISIGPDIYGPHAPGEKMSISSVERTYELLLKVLENM